MNKSLVYQDVKDAIASNNLILLINPVVMHNYTLEEAKLRISPNAISLMKSSLLRICNIPIKGVVYRIHIKDAILLGQYISLKKSSACVVSKTFQHNCSLDDIIGAPKFIHYSMTASIYKIYNYLQSISQQI